MSSKTFRIRQNGLLGYTYVEKIISTGQIVSDGNCSNLEDVFRHIRRVYTGEFDAPAPEGGEDFRPLRDRLDAEISRLRSHLLAIEAVAALSCHPQLLRMAAEAVEGAPAPEVEEGLPVRKLGSLPGVNINLTLEESERLSGGLSDILCWANGFRAALGDNLDRAPLGIEAVREMQRQLNRAQAAAVKDQKKS